MSSGVHATTAPTTQACHDPVTREPRTTPTPSEQPRAAVQSRGVQQGGRCYRCRKKRTCDKTNLRNPCGNFPPPRWVPRAARTYVFSNCYSNFWLMFGKLREARSRLYRSRILQVNAKVLKLLTRSTRLTRFCTAQHSKFQPNLVKWFRIFTLQFLRLH